MATKKPQGDDQWRYAWRAAYWCAWWLRTNRPTQILAAVLLGLALTYGFAGASWSLAYGVCVLASAVALIARRGPRAAWSWLRFVPTVIRIRRTWKRPALDSETGLRQESWGLRSYLTGESDRYPRVAAVRREDSAIRVTVERLPGHGSKTWAKSGPILASRLGLVEPSVTVSNRWVDLRFPHTSGIKPWSAKVPSVLPDLTKVPVARTRHGGTWHLRVLGSHILIAGATGSGKGSVLWSIVTQLSPGIADGTVEVWGVDPKGGIELGMGEELFSRFAAGEARDDDLPWQTSLADLLDEAVVAMQKRLSAMRRDRSRLHTPTPGEPLIVVVVDEFLSLTAAVNDPKLVRRIDSALTTLLSQGRAAGVTVIGAAQVAQKTALKAEIRDLFPHRICLRVTDATQVDMALGAGARARGAVAEDIDEDAAGTAYVLEDGRNPVLVRFPWTPDERIRKLAESRPARRRQASPVVQTQEQPETVEDVPVRNVKRQKVEDVLAAAREAGEVLTINDVAARADCSRQYAGRIMAEVDA